jgi:hypothetical protein
MKWNQKTYPIGGFFFSCECESLGTMVICQSGEMLNCLTFYLDERCTHSYTL